jgi:hypothetical protein
MNGEPLLLRLMQLIKDLKKEGDFISMKHFAQQKAPA